MSKKYAGEIALRILADQIKSKSPLVHDHSDLYYEVEEMNPLLDEKTDKSEFDVLSKKVTDLSQDAVRFYVGTRAQYEAAYANGEILINTLVVITDDESVPPGGSGGDNASSQTSSLLGTGVLGYMILG